jgi:hypothetical protein
LPVVDEPLLVLLKKESMLKRESREEVCFLAESKVDCMLAKRLLPGAIWIVSGCTTAERERRRMSRREVDRDEISRIVFRLIEYYRDILEDWKL